MRSKPPSAVMPERFKALGRALHAPAPRWTARRCAAASTISTTVPPAQVLSALATDTALVLARVDIAENPNEIPAAGGGRAKYVTGDFSSAADVQGWPMDETRSGSTDVILSSTAPGPARRG